MLLFCVLQFSFRSKDKYDKKYKPYRSGLGEVNEGNESNDSDQPSKVQTMSEADVGGYLELMLVSIRLADFLFILFFEPVSVVALQKFAVHCFCDEWKLWKCQLFSRATVL